MRVPKEIGEAVVLLLQPYTEHHLTVQDIEEMLVKKEFLPEPEQEKLLTRKEAGIPIQGVAYRRVRVP